MSTAFLYARTTPTEHGENYRPDCDRCGITVTNVEHKHCDDCTDYLEAEARREARLVRGQRRARRG